jgi:hypothetical protein
LIGIGGIAAALLAWTVLGPATALVSSVPAVGLLALRFRRPPRPMAPLPRAAAVGVIVSALLCAASFVGTWRADWFWPEGFNGQDVAFLGLVTSLGAALGVAWMARARSWDLGLALTSLAASTYDVSVILWAFAAI